MVGYFEDKELSARKRLVLAESDIYRETLKVEARNLGLYTLTIRQRLAWFTVANPAFAVLGPLVQTWLARRRRKRLGWFGRAIWAWQLYRRFFPLLSQFAARWAAGRAGKRVAPAPSDPSSYHQRV